MCDNDLPAGIDFGGECDLHFFAPKDTAVVVKEFIRQAMKKGIREIRLVHGKGRSVKKREVYEILKKHPSVKSFRHDGANWGATIILLNSEP